MAWSTMVHAMESLEVPIPPCHGRPMVHAMDYFYSMPWTTRLYFKSSARHDSTATSLSLALGASQRQGTTPTSLLIAQDHEDHGHAISPEPRPRPHRISHKGHNTVRSQQLRARVRRAAMSVSSSPNQPQIHVLPASHSMATCSPWVASHHTRSRSVRGKASYPIGRSNSRILASHTSSNSRSGPHNPKHVPVPHLKNKMNAVRPAHASLT